MTRVVSGVAMALFAVALLFLGSPNVFFLFIVAVVAVCLFELFDMFEKGSQPALKTLGIVSGAGFCAAVYFGDASDIVAFTGLVVVIIFIAAILSGGADTASMASNTIFGVFYIAATLATFALIRREPDGASYIAMLVAASALSDTFAYYTGRAFGKTKLAPLISPNKTVEGFIGGIAGAVIGACAMKLIILPDLDILHSIVVGLISGFIGPAGDLAESAIKRSTGVKDSGKLIPGHGGFLDRVDNLMFCGPAFYVYYQLLLMP